MNSGDIDGVSNMMSTTHQTAVGIGGGDGGGGGGTTTIDKITKNTDLRLEQIDQMTKQILNDSESEEKRDVRPENSAKSSLNCSPEQETVRPLTATNPCSDRSLDKKIQSSDVINTCDKSKTVESDQIDTSKQSAFAFTIDFGDGKKVDNKKYQDIVERFQKRHRRGSSLSKFDDENTPEMVGNTAKIKSMRKVMDAQPVPVVKLRDKTKLSVKEPNKRHSWSPRTSLQNNNYEVVRHPEPKTDEFGYKPKSTTMQRVLQSSAANKIVQSKVNYQRTNEHDTIPCLEPPLIMHRDSDSSSVSEAGTYTLDGDNYTEEQKEQMSIDKAQQQQRKYAAGNLKHKKFFEKSTNLSRRPNLCDDLEITDLECTNHTQPRHRNILEVSYVQEDPPQKVSYLDKIKSRVKTIGERTFSSKGRNTAGSPVLIVDHKPPDDDHDVGTFTSVTTSGVLSKKPMLTHSTPGNQFARHNSLTKSQIDSSEYVQKIPGATDKLMNSYTDYEKAKHKQYQLNIFTTSVQNIPPESVPHVQPEYISKSAIKTAHTKNDWIQEWARNARRTNQSPTKQIQPVIDHPNSNQFGGSDGEHHYEIDRRTDPSNSYEEFGDNLECNYVREKSMARGTNLENRNSAPPNSGLSSRQTIKAAINYAEQNVSNIQYEPKELNILQNRPPISPTKIPSPVHTISGRSFSKTRNYGSNTELDKNDTEMYLEKTAAAISTLQHIHHSNKNSPQSPLSPIRKEFPLSAQRRIQLLQQESSNYVDPNYANDEDEENRMSAYLQSLRQQHKRNFSFDGGSPYRKHLLTRNEMLSHSYNSDGLNCILNLNSDGTRKHSRHNSYEDPRTNKVVKNVPDIDQTSAYSPRTFVRKQLSNKYSNNIDNQLAINKLNNVVVANNAILNSPIRRSSSFSVKPRASVERTYTPTTVTKVKTQPLQKSASSNSFKKMESNYGIDDLADFYVNDEDDLNPNHFSSDSEFSESGEMKAAPPITNTKYNKAFLMRMEQNKQKAFGTMKQQQGQLQQTIAGVVACPNTPELPRRGSNVRPARQMLRDRVSMPRDSSINRMKQDLQASLSSTKKSLTTTAKTLPDSCNSSSSGKKVLPKYLDISKYKPSQGQTFLKRDETKSTLVQRELRRSPSAASVGFVKTDPNRSSIRSVKSAGSKPAQIAANKSREAEMEMWRRRAKYDPMKAAAEGRKKQDDVRRSINESSKFSQSHAVLRSQSYHYGIGQSTMAEDSSLEITDDDTIKSNRHRWTLISTESSEDEFYDNS